MSIRSGKGEPVYFTSLILNESYPISEDAFFQSVALASEEAGRGTLLFWTPESGSILAEEAAAASDRGAAGIVYPKEETLDTSSLREDFLAIPAGNVRNIYGQACQALFDDPAKKLKMIAITGTSGKTSTSYIIAGMLAESGEPVGLIGSLGVYDGQTLRPERQTPPNPYELAQWLDRMVENGCTHAILEISSQAIVEERIAGIKFDAVCLTNIRRNHLDLHQTVDLYRRTKMRIFQYAKPNALVVCNADDRVTSAALHLIEQPTMTISLRPDEGMVTGLRVEQTRSEQTFYIIAGSDAIPVETKMIGDETIYNCLMAAALGISWNIDLKTVVRGIERVEHIPGRLERIDCGQPFSVYVDNAHTPESLQSVLKTVRKVTEGTLYCVLSAPEDKDRSKRPMMGRVAESIADTVIVTVNRDAEDTGSVDDLLRGMEQPARCVQKMSRRCDAIIWALSNAASDDSVLVIGSDLGPDADPEEIVSDRQFVRHWLYENQPCLDSYWGD